MNIFKLIKLLFSSKQYVIYVINKKDEIIKKESSNITEDFQHHIFNDSRVSLINNVILIIIFVIIVLRKILNQQKIITMI